MTPRLCPSTPAPISVSARPGRMAPSRSIRWWNRLLKAQGIGGSMSFIASKNGVAASPLASAYCTAKAEDIHLARCMALDGAPMGIRVNVVNPDAVLRGSRIWQGSGVSSARPRTSSR